MDNVPNGIDPISKPHLITDKTKKQKKKHEIEKLGNRLDH